MRVHFILFFLLISRFGNAQESVFYNSWQYFDKDGNYNELTVSKKHVYRYWDSSGVTRYTSKLKGNKLLFDKEEWTLRKSDSLSITVTAREGDTIILYKLQSLGDELIDYYDWENEKYRNGNGYMILLRHAEERKTSLFQILKRY